MEAARAVGATHDGLLDIGRPRRPADEIDGAWQPAPRRSSPAAGPTPPRRSRRYRTRRSARCGPRAGNSGWSGCRCRTAGTRSRSRPRPPSRATARPGRPARRGRTNARYPRLRATAARPGRVGPHADLRRQIAGAEIGGDRADRLLRRGDPAHIGALLGQHGGEQRHALGAAPCGARWNSAARVALQPPRDRAPSGPVQTRHAECCADAVQHVARASSAALMPVPFAAPAHRGDGRSCLAGQGGRASRSRP